MFKTASSSKSGKTTYRFGSVLIALFSGLSIPILAIVLLVTYFQNSRAMREQLREQIERGRDRATRNVHQFFIQPISILEGLTEVATSYPDYFRGNESIAIIKSALSSVDHMDSMYVTFEDGNVRGATRIDEIRRKQQSGVPEDAIWQTYTVEPTADQKAWQYHRIFYANWPKVIKLAGEASSIDPRSSPNYVGAKQTRQLHITRPGINHVSGESTIKIASPILVEGKFVGAVQGNLTVSELSHFLALNRQTKNSISVIVDDAGEILIPPVDSSASADSRFSMASFVAQSRIKERIDQALTAKSKDTVMRSIFPAEIDGTRHTVSLFEIPNSLGIRWKVLTLTPDSDLVGALEKTNATILWLLAIIIPLQLVLIYRVSGRTSRNLRIISEQVSDIQKLQFREHHYHSTGFSIKEFVDIRQAVALLQNALKSFSQYIPVGVVRDLVESGRPLSLGVEQRELTILFSDLENFSGLTQRIAADDVLDHLTGFFSSATDAIANEHGTVDKFIGDAIMAFWGAPHPLADQQLRACAAALRITRRVEKLNALWKKEGKDTLHVRTGLHCSQVLVGNIGSSERLSYTAIGDGVNIASRLEGVNKQFGTSICMSDSVYAHVAEHVVARPLQMVSVKGRVGEFMVYELLGIKGSAEPELAAKEA